MDEYTYDTHREDNTFTFSHQALVTIDHVHRHVCRGLAWHVSDIMSLGNAATGQILFHVGAMSANTTFSCSVGANCFAYLYEGTTITGASSGTQMTAHNMNRAVMLTASATVFAAPSGISVTGTALYQTLIAGGAVRMNILWLLKPDTTYLLRVANRTTNIIDATVSVEWCEM